MTTAQDGTVTATPVIPSWTLADRLRKVRREVAQAEQIEFARTLEVGAPTYAAWESGRTQPRNPVAVAKRVEVATGVPASWMLGLDEPSPRGDGPSPGSRHEKSSGGATTRKYPGTSRPAICPPSQVTPLAPRRAGHRRVAA